MKKALACLLATCFLFSFTACTGQKNVVLAAEDFEKAIGKDSVQVLDVRTPGEYFSGHIKGALQADWNDRKEFERRVAFVDKTKPVYVYCLAGGRSAAAAAKLRSMGYENVLELKGGINAWRAASKPLEGDNNQPQMSLEQFTASISGGKTVLVDFGAEWCPPCKKMEPVIKSLQAAAGDKFTLLKVDGGRDQDIMKKYGVTALPVFIVFKNGTETWRKEGVADLKELEEAVK